MSIERSVIKSVERGRGESEGFCGSVRNEGDRC